MSLRRHLPLLAAAAALSTVTGCASIRTQYTQPNGQPLGVYDQTRSYLYNVDVKTGSVRNSAGQEILATYQRETRVGTERVWFGMQGAQKIDEESFYRIAGDQDAVARYRDYREGGVTQNLIGLIMMGGGFAVGAGGIGMIVGANSCTGCITGYDDGLGTAGYLMAVGGLIVGGIGVTLTLMGKGKAESPNVRIINDPERMKAAAQQYNQKLFGDAGEQ